MYKRVPRIPEKVKRPYYIKVPKNAEKCYFYGRFNIVGQKKALWHVAGEFPTLRCSEPFTIEVTIKGKPKTIKSKKEKEVV